MPNITRNHAITYTNHIILVIKQIGLLLRGRPLLLITCMITDRIGLHSVLLPLQIFLITVMHIISAADSPLYCSSSARKCLILPAECSHQKSLILLEILLAEFIQT